MWGCKGPNAKSGWPLFFLEPELVVDEHVAWRGTGTWRGEGRARGVARDEHVSWRGQLIKRGDKIKFFDKEKIINQIWFPYFLFSSF